MWSGNQTVIEGVELSISATPFPDTSASKSEELHTKLNNTDLLKTGDIK